MNREFMVKMVKAKQFQYEAMKEILPEKIVKRVDRLESEFFDMARECILSVVSDAEKNQSKDMDKAPGIRKVTIE